jgi:hypothetical protein
VITDGSVQAYEELYFWAAQDLAEAGYMVMTYDVQGQGDSSLFGTDCPGECTGVPYQQDSNFFQGAEDSLSFFLATPDALFGGSYNPFAPDLDSGRIGLAGHSLGASAVSHVGQCDNRVSTIVAWDNLRAIKDCSGVVIAPQHRTKKLINVPALAVTNDYAFNTTPAQSRPDPEAKTAGYRQVAAAGVDAQIVALRGATHLAYTSIPLVFQSNQLGERMASYYTKAWFDLQLRGDRTGFDRLTAAAFDRSVDVTSIGAGTYDPTQADPLNPYAGNVPYLIDGIPVKDAVSFYYRSAYTLRDPRDGRRSRGATTCAPAVLVRAASRASAGAESTGAPAGAAASIGSERDDPPVVGAADGGCAAGRMQRRRHAAAAAARAHGQRVEGGAAAAQRSGGGDTAGRGGVREVLLRADQPRSRYGRAGCRASGVRSRVWRVPRVDRCDGGGVGAGRACRRRPVRDRLCRVATSRGGRGHRGVAVPGEPDSGY